VNLGVSTDLSFIGLVANASVIVQMVMLLLLAVSLFSWWYIFLKMFAIRQATAQSDAFEREFWSGNDLASMAQRAADGYGKGGSVANFRK
jgi:biopolymer transport protein TolQ